jgi:hypothetical protein
MEISEKETQSLEIQWFSHQMANLVASQNFSNPNDSKRLDETRNKKAMLKQ